MSDRGQEREAMTPEQIVRETASEYARDLRRKARRKFTEERTTAEIAAFERSAQQIEDALAALAARESAAAVVTEDGVST